MELPQAERSSGPDLPPDFDMTPYSRMGDDHSTDEVGIKESIQKAADLRKSEYRRQLDAKEDSPHEEPDPSQPLPHDCSESEPEEQPPGNVENITYAEDGQLLREAESGRGPWFSRPQAAKGKKTENKMKDFQLRLSQRKLHEKPYSIPDYLLPLIPQECVPTQQHI